jgi:hypothetical protein
VRPTSDLGALAAAIHLDTYEDHETPCSCQWRGRDVAEAQRLLDALGAIGWHIAKDIALPSEAPAGRRETSRKAAESIRDLSDRQWAVWWSLGSRGPLTDEELIERYGWMREQFNLPPQTPQSIRTRRAELVRAGHVVDSGERRPTKSNRMATVWRAVGDSESREMAA